MTDEWLDIEVAGKRGFVDATGAELLAPRYDFVRRIADDRAFARDGDESFVMNASGERLYDVDARGLMPTREDRTPFMRKGRWGFLDAAGDEVVAPRFDSVFVGLEDGAVRVGMGAVQVLVDRDGNELIPDAKEIRQSPRGGIVPFRSKNKKWGLFSVRTREVVVDPSYAEIFGLAGDHWILKKSAKSWGAADAQGEVVIPAKRPWLNAICEDRGATRDKAKKVGFVDGMGVQVIEHRFESRGGQDDLSRFRDGRCAVQLNEKIGFIDHEGEMVVPARFVNGFFFGEGIGSVVDDEGWAYVDETGTPISNERFERGETFESGIAVVTRAGKTGAMRRDGALVVPVMCSRIRVANGVLRAFSEAGHTAYYRADGSCIWKHAEFDLELAPTWP